MASLLYAVFKAADLVADDEFTSSYRKLGPPRQGHPTPARPWVDVVTGSLGQGLPDAVGIAIAGQYLDMLAYRVCVLCGEALDKAARFGLSNLTVIVNRLGMRGPRPRHRPLLGQADRRGGAVRCCRPSRRTGRRGRSPPL